MEAQPKSDAQPPDETAELQRAIAVFQRQFRNSSAALPFFPGIGRALLPPTWQRPALVVPLDGHYVVQEPIVSRPVPWLTEMFARELSKFHYFLDVVKPHLDFSALPNTDVDGLTPFFPNSFFGPMDAAALTGMLVMLRPQRYVEIGSGMSTRFARRAIQQFDLPTKIVCIDPAPRSSITAIADQVIADSLVNVNVDIFNSLEENDILFFDGSHICFSGTDCPKFFLEILPGLSSGVCTHVHDIFLPNEYPDRLKTRFYNEQQLLAAFLYGNRKFEVLLPVNHLHTLGYCPEGVSFWMKRTAESGT